MIDKTSVPITSNMAPPSSSPIIAPSPIPGVTDDLVTNDIPTLLKQYEIINDQFKHQSELGLKYLGFYLTLTGAIVSYYLIHKNEPLMRYSLALPFFTGIMLGIIAIAASRSQQVYADELNIIAHKLYIGAFPSFHFIKALYVMMAALAFIIVTVLAILFFAT